MFDMKLHSYIRKAFVFRSSRGLTLIEVVLGIGLVVLLFGAIFSAVFSVLDVIENSKHRAAATRMLNERLEIMRNLPYDQIGTVGGVPVGILPQTETVTSTDGLTFTVQTTVRNIDDPFDGTIGGAPNDTAPADYKLAELEVSCLDCGRFVPLLVTTTFAPENLEAVGDAGSLFVNVFDASGLPVTGADVRVVNNTVSPTIDFIDTTNNNGVLQLVGMPTSTQAYEVTVSKSGFSSAQTYPPGAPANPNPTQPHATIASQTLTEISFAIDVTSTIVVRTSDVGCAPIASVPVTITGAKLIGTDPDVVKFSTSTTTDASGEWSYDALEWDTYSLMMTDSSYDVVGTLPLAPIVVNPSSTADVRFALAPADPNALLVTITDSGTGSGIQGASVHIAGGSVSSTLVTGHGFLGHTDWSGVAYDSQSGGVATESPAGELRLVGSPGTYPTSTTEWLISRTIDTGASGTTYYAFGWEPTTQDPQTGADSVRFQLASNNDNATWNFVGPDGTANTYYTTSGQVPHSTHAGDRYLRYKVFLQTADENVTPLIEDVRVEFNGTCVPTAHTLFTELTNGDYALTVSAGGYQTATTTATVSGAWQQMDVPLTAQP